MNCHVVCGCEVCCLVMICIVVGCFEMKGVVMNCLVV